MLSDEQMRKIWPFSLLNDEQMSNKVEVKHQPVINGRLLTTYESWDDPPSRRREFFLGFIILEGREKSIVRGWQLVIFVGVSYFWQR